jgi:hypothetical protein
MALRPRWSSLALALLVAGCATGGAATPSASGTMSLEPTEHAAAATSGTPQPTAGGPTVAILGTAPVISSEAGPAGHAYALPAAFARAPDGTYALFVVWFGAAPGDQIVTVSTSVDGRTWSVGTTPIYADLGLEFRSPGPVPSTALVLEDGTWVLYGWGWRTTDPGFVTWRATAPAPTGPWTAGPGRVLEAGAEGAWDAGTAAAATVLEVPGGQVMWYDGDPGGGGIRGAIGRAGSTDGIHWQKDSGPVLAPGACGPRTSGAVVQPQVWAGADGFHMLFAALQAGIAVAPIYGAASDDGRAWRCLSDAPLLEATDIPGSQGIHRIHGGTIDGRPVLFVESLGTSSSDIWLAAVSFGP